MRRRDQSGLLKIEGALSAGIDAGANGELAGFLPLSPFLFRGQRWPPCAGVKLLTLSSGSAAAGKNSHFKLRDPGWHQRHIVQQHWSEGLLLCYCWLRG